MCIYIQTSMHAQTSMGSMHAVHAWVDTYSHMHACVSMLACTDKQAKSPTYTHPHTHLLTNGEH